MAASSKKPAAKKPAKRKSPARETKATQQAKKQMWAVVLFALGILLGALTFIKGEKLWLSFHNFLFGIFGWSVYFLAPLIIYIAVYAAMDKPLSSIKAKLWQVGALIIMISGAIQIFGAGLPDEGSFGDNFLALYEGGKNLSGGGVSGAAFAVPLLSLFEKTGASIIIVLAIFVFAMLITGSTLISLYRFIVNPVQKMEREYADRVSEKEDRAPAPKPPPKTLKTPPKTPKKPEARFNIDVPIDDSPLPADDDFTPPPGQTAQPESEVPEGLDTETPVYSGSMPEHPVVSARETSSEELEEDDSLDRLLAAIGQDRPVEYVSPEEFARPAAPTPAYEEPEEAPVEEPAHPLDNDILEILSNSSEDDLFSQQFSQAEDSDLELVEVPDEPTTYEEISIAEGLPAAPLEYRYPPVSLLKLGRAVSGEDVSEELKGNAQTLVDTLKSFGVQTRIIDICRGPAVTRYELQPSAGVKISKITGLADDIALNLAAAGIRIEAPIPNKAAVGIEVPNKTVSVVSIRDIIDSPEFSNAETSTPIALGKDIAGKIQIADIGKMPHMLIAGATGSGKSVCINSIIMSLLYKSSPDEVKLLMIDPKVVELGVYNGIPHLLIPVVTDPKKAAGALNWAVTEMLNRYKTFADNGVRDLSGYNRLAEERRDEGAEALAPMPKIVIIIDELADLMMAAPNDVEDAICRLAQMARAAGMHLVIATQRPSVDVITGVIKANIPSRIAFAVSSQVDSRTILDMGGAEKLLGRGDMLFYPVGSAKPLRVQGCFVTDSEVESVVSYVKAGEATVYDQNIVEEIDRHAVAEKGKGSKSSDGGGFDDEDEMLPQAIECVVEMGQASTSALQRRLKLGYARAARIIDQLEERGIVGPFEGSKPRQVLISKERWIEMKLMGAENGQLKLSSEQAEETV